MTYLLVFFLIISGCNQKKNNKKQTPNFLNTDPRDLIDNKTIKNENLKVINPSSKIFKNKFYFKVLVFVYLFSWYPKSIMTDDNGISNIIET